MSDLSATLKCPVGSWCDIVGSGSQTSLWCQPQFQSHDAGRVHPSQLQQEVEVSGREERTTAAEHITDDERSPKQQGLCGESASPNVFRFTMEIMSEMSPARTLSCVSPSCDRCVYKYIKAENMIHLKINAQLIRVQGFLLMYQTLESSLKSNFEEKLRCAAILKRCTQSKSWVT